MEKLETRPKSGKIMAETPIKVGSDRKKPFRPDHFLSGRNHPTTNSGVTLCEKLSNQKVGGVQALITSHGTGPTQRKRCGLRLSK